MNCLGCISSEYFYKNDTYDCIKPNEFDKKENLEFTKIDNIYFVIFLLIFIVALIIFVCNCIFYKIKEQKNKEDENVQKKQEDEKDQKKQEDEKEQKNQNDKSQKKNESKENKDDNIELAQYNDFLKIPINEI